MASEFPVETPPLRENFPRRNRIVSGLAWATVVVEGRLKSGSRITARLAAEQGRQVFAVPGPADSPLSEAPHALLEEGALLWKGVAGLARELPPGTLPLAPAQAKVLELIGPQAPTLEELARGLELPLPRVSALLLELELLDLIAPQAGQRYAKR